jgi:DNA helicase II / ATP-dependent DNA helicase PcrA
VAEPESSPVGESDAYSPKQRREAQANVFGRELLLPRDRLRATCLVERSSAEALAARLGLPVALVRQQMADALLMPAEPPADGSGEPPALDESQRHAAEAVPGPLQVRAGPGTGKTRTLLARVAWLIRDRRADPSSILALTYSNGSAEDLARRLRTELGGNATSVWCSTFHAFGQELLRLYGDRLGLPASPRPIDRPDGLFLLEEEFGRLRLDHYFDPQEPLRGLKVVLDSISRAKDELCGPERYRACAAAMEPGVARDKALEAAQVYEVYDAALRSAGAVDFGDLIGRSVELLRNFPEIAAEVRTTRRCVRDGGMCWSTNIRT